LAFTRSRTQRAYNSSAVPPRSRRAIDPSLSVTLGSLSFPSLQSPARRTARNMGGKCKKVLAASRATRKPSRWANQAGSRRGSLWSGKRHCLGCRPRSAPRRHRRRALAAKPSRCRGKLAPRTHRSSNSFKMLPSRPAGRRRVQYAACIPARYGVPARGAVGLVRFIARENFARGSEPASDYSGV
jgi:hypothetical protein